MHHPWSPHLFASQAKKLGRSNAVIDIALETADAIKRVHPDLPVIFSLNHLAHLTDVTWLELRRFVTRDDVPPLYRVFKLQKKPKLGSRQQSRGKRTICIPRPSLMRVQRWIAQNILIIEPHEASFAFFPNRGIREAAQRHAGCSWLIKMDVTDFFHSITEYDVFKVFRRLGYSSLLSFELTRICTRPLDGDDLISTNLRGLTPYHGDRIGRLPQGAPTSPMLANLAAAQLDETLKKVANKYGWSYTRYADDLAFSTRKASSRKEARKLVSIVKDELRRAHLEPNDGKTVIAPPGARRIVLGLQVDSAAPKLTRSFRNNLETHVYALTADHIGPAKHMLTRGFDSLIGMRRHILGLLSHAHHIDPDYAATVYERFNSVQWPT